uniref:Retrotransposon protein, putative, Ty1-copia subclass n=1 Tax=Tanacetum cinerariifolium TaxID=118510 RepID=A0A6L2K5G9_TANCI|nr:hypothetical protein [Tanacetum cinerariifolium]
MANTFSSKGLFLIIIIFLIFSITSNASDQAMQNDYSSQLLLRKLGMKVSDLEYYKRRSLDVNPGRVAPGGPDGQHHFASSPQLHLVLSTEDKENYLELPIPEAPELKSMFSKQAKQELLQTVREFYACKQEEGQSVSSYVLKMKGYIDNLERIGQPLGQNLAKDANLALHAIRAGMVKKNQKNKPHKAAKEGHGKGKGKICYAPNNAPFAPKPKTPPPPKKDNPAKDAICHQCGLRGSKKLKPCALSLYVGDGHRAAIEAIKTYHLELLVDYFINRFDENNVISVSKNNLVYFMAVLRDGIFEIDMSCSNTNDSSMYVISNKRAKINLDSSLLWHCRLRHISKKQIEKLQHDGLLNSIDIESLGKCVSCMSRKMARKPYSHQVERAKDLLGLMHTDVCGPFRIVSRQRANYFVTFTDDSGHYGYVYLLKHKHEVFETFKGCETLVKRDTLTKPDKLDPRYFRCIFVGYPKETMRYSFYSPSENKVFVAQNAEFFENDLIDLKARDLGEPANYKAALLDPESKKWLDAMNVEMQSIKDNDVWVLVELPPNARTVGSKWLFKKKADMDGAVYVFKARLVAKGLTQTYRVDYEETFSPVVGIRAIRILIAIAAYYDYEIWQCNKQFNDEIKKFDFTQNRNEPCVYQKTSGSYVTILILYVDDILLTGNNIPMLQDVKSYLRRSFTMKDLGDVAYILGIKIYRDRSKQLIGLCQSAYVKKILKRYYMENSKRGTILMQKKLKLSKSQGEEHWSAVKNILKYLRNTKDMFLVYGGNIERELRVSCYTNAGYLTDADDLKSQTGYVFILNRDAVNWKSTKQIIFATSSTDAEYIAAFDASIEAVWIRKFISRLGIVLTIEEPINMYCDNTRAIAIAKDDGAIKGARHFRAKVHYLRETIKLGDVKIEKVDTDDNLADPFTKALAFPKHSKLTRNIIMLPASSFI